MFRKNEFSVMFVCLGNIIRSPTCEGLLRTLVTDNVFVDSSAVTRDDLGQHPNEYAQEVCKEHGFDISSHVSKLITKDDFYKFDLIVSLENIVFFRLNDKKPDDASGKVVRFSSMDISNPCYGVKRDFDEMYSEIEREMKKFVKKHIPSKYLKQ